jgi:hypothetical protein
MELVAELGRVVESVAIEKVVDERVWKKRSTVWWCCRRSNGGE